jgi:hypothetical protein
MASFGTVDRSLYTPVRRLWAMHTNISANISILL